jgi:hypothetical protein
MSAAAKMEHPGALKLRRLHAGEDVGAEVSAHVSACDECQARLKEFTREQQSFEAAIPFERFAAGVERARRTPREIPAQRSPVMQVVLSLAAMVLVAVGFGTMFGGGGSTNRIKGGGIDIKIAGTGGVQRSGPDNGKATEALARGERVRIQYSAGTWHYLAVLSIDESGTVTPLYPESGTSLPITPEARAWLPDSVEFTGTGLERVVVVMTQDPTDMQLLAKEAKRRYEQARGDVAKMEPLEVPGEQFHRTFLKP